MLRRSYMKRGSSVLKRTRIKQRSPGKADANAKYATAKAEHFAEHPGCQFPGCTRSLRKNDLIDIHHRAGRNGPLLYRREYFSSLCREHHDHIETHLSWARANGWIVDLPSSAVHQMRLEESVSQT